MTKTKTLLATLFLSTVSTAAFAHHASEASANFVANASMSDKYEIASSKLALSHSSNPDVKAFASQMIRDHTKSTAQLKTAIASSHLNAQPATQLDAPHQDMLNELRQSRGGEFDSAYINQQDNAHNDAVSLFQDYADNGDNRSLKMFARKTLPTLQQHLEHVQQLESQH